MKNGKNFHIKRNDVIMNNFFFLCLILNFVIQSIFATDISLKISGTELCKIYIKDISTFYTTPNDHCFIIGNDYLHCDLSSDEYEVNLTNGINSAKNMFKDCYGLENINLTLFDFSQITEIDGMFENCISLKSIHFSNFGSNNLMNMSRMFYNCSLLETISVDENIIQTTSAIDMSYMFLNCSSLTSLNLSLFIGNGKVNNMSHMFERCSKLEQLELPESLIISGVENMEFMFSKCSSLEFVNLDNIDLSLVTSMNSMFKDCPKLYNVTFSKSGTSSLINMGSMFQSCTSFESIDLSNFDTTSVSFLNDLFHDCTALNSIKLSGWNTEYVIRMESMFENCKSLTKIELPNFYTPSVRQIYNLFSGCISVTSIDISSFDTFQITNFVNLFYNCQKLTTIVDLTNFVTNMASDISYMFYNCSSINSTDLSAFNTERVVKMNSMFQGCSNLVSLKMTNFDNRQVLDMGHLFHGCAKLITLDLSNFNTTIVKNMEGMFSGCISLLSLDLSKFETENVVNMNSMFYDCSSLQSLSILSLNTSKVTDMSFMFYECSLLSSIELSQFQTSNVEKIDAMFYNCKSLKSLSLSSFDTSKIKSMKSTFQGCSFIEELHLANFNTKRVNYMDGLFYDCSSLIRLNISNFDISIVKSMGYMFHGCKSITSLVLPNIKKLEVKNTTYMFAGCSSLTSLNLFSFDSRLVRNMDYMFSGCTYLKLLNLTKWNTKEVTSMNYMFSGCMSLTSLNISDFDTPNLQSIKGLFYGCSSLKFIDLANLNTSLVTNMAYMFYKASSLISLNFFTYNIITNYNFSSISESYELMTYFNTSSVENMKYMFAYCRDLEYIDLSFFNTSRASDMSYMFSECTTLTSVNLSGFDTSNVITMEYMFYKCLNLSYINLFNAKDTDINTNNILTDSLLNMVFCIKENEATQIKKIIDEKNGCSIIYCGDEDYNKHRKLLLVENPLSSSSICVDDCKSVNRYYYLYRCYKDDCPNGTYHEEDDYICYPDSVKPDPCTIQKVLIHNCTMEALKVEYKDTKEDKIQFIEDLKTEIRKKFTLPEYILQNGIISETIFNDTYHFSTLSNKNLYDNITFINIKDCENFLKKSNDIDENEELILFKIEYLVEDFKIPIIEYTVYSIDGKKELNFSECESMNFVYSYNIEINETEEFKYDPNSDYNNEICFQFTTEYKTDITLYNRRKEFNDYNLSLCESNCIYLGYSDRRVECECPVKEYFNQFLLEEDSVKDNLIFRFKNNHLEPYNFGILKCFKNHFTKSGITDNYPSIVFIALIGGNIVGAFFFCIRGYKVLYSRIKSLAEGPSKNKGKNKSFISTKTKGNIITSGNNPPPKIKGEKASDKKENDMIDNQSELNTKINVPNNLIDSNNMFNKGNDNNLIKKQPKATENYIFGKKTPMELNILPYSEAKIWDQRKYFGFYVSLLKTRHLLLCVFMNDDNSFVIKLSLLLFTLGVCIGINTFFFDDSTIETIYNQKGNYTIGSHIGNHIVPIIISTFIASIIKSIMFLTTLTDVTVLQVKENNNIKKEERINRALVQVTSKSIIYFIVSFVLLFLFWIYSGTFSAIFKNTKIFLLINGVISFVGVLLLPLLYCFLTAALRRVALDGENRECFYKFVRILQLI